MTSYHSPLLKDRVPYDWEELKRAAQELKHGSIPGLSDVEATSRTIAPQPETTQHSDAIENPEPQSKPVQARPEHDQATSLGLSEEELVARIVPKVVERLNSQIEIIVDVTLKTAATRIRSADGQGRTQEALKFIRQGKKAAPLIRVRLFHL